VNGYSKNTGDSVGVKSLKNASEWVRHTSASSKGMRSAGGKKKQDRGESIGKTERGSIKSKRLEGKLSFYRNRRTCKKTERKRGRKKGPMQD